MGASISFDPHYDKIIQDTPNICRIFGIIKFVLYV